jgi:hypothetical protein
VIRVCVYESRKTRRATQEDTDTERDEHKDN